MVECLLSTGPTPSSLVRDGVCICWLFLGNFFIGLRGSFYFSKQRGNLITVMVFKLQVIFTIRTWTIINNWEFFLETRNVLNILGFKIGKKNIQEKIPNISK